ncbi:MAG TPA: phosphate ABC transporter permease PtsA [Armatimonadetes bacterium]|nr:phosphate ABC transporter permease PtsA [Armatimonadota bacterium]
MNSLAVADAQLAARHRAGRRFEVLLWLMTAAGVVMLVLLLIQILTQGATWVRGSFLTGVASIRPERAGFLPAIVGSVAIIAITGLVAVPVGVAAAVYLEEFAPRNRLTSIIETNVSNLAGVPAIVYGLLGLALFVRALSLGRSLLSGALTLAILVLPTIIIASREAIRAVPQSLRLAALAVGATRWQTTWHHVLPAALPGVLTSVILALSRALGEAAPLLVIGAASYVPFLPRKLSDSFTAMPIQIYTWSAMPQAQFQNVAAAGIIVLLVVLLSMNATAIIIRQRAGSKLKW